MRTVSSAEVQKNFGAFREVAASEPLLVQHYGQPSVVIISFEEYERLKTLDAEVVRFDDLADDELQGIAEAEIPAEYRYHSDDVREP